MLLRQGNLWLNIFDGILLGLNSYSTVTKRFQHKHFKRLKLTCTNNHINYPYANLKNNQQYKVETAEYDQNFERQKKKMQGGCGYRWFWTL